MKDKFIDTSLLVILIVVALAIFGTLLNSFGLDISNIFPSRGPAPIAAGPQADPVVILDSALSNDTASDGVIPVVPSDGSNQAVVEVELADPLAQNDGAVTPLDPNALPSEEAAAIPSDPAITEVGEVEATPVEEAPPVITPVESGAFTLERIGFSAVTGGVGACNVILEPWKHIAVSRDIRATHPCGSSLTIQLDSAVAGRQSFTGIVADTMNPSKTKTVNVYVESQELALSYGVNGGTLEP